MCKLIMCLCDVLQGVKSVCIGLWHHKRSLYLGHTVSSCMPHFVVFNHSHTCARTCVSEGIFDACVRVCVRPCVREVRGICTRMTVQVRSESLQVSVNPRG